MYLRALAATAALLLASCGSLRLPVPEFKPYRMEIQQGNFVSQEMVSQLKLGMTKDQVRFALGTPLITDSFHAERWDYVFWRQKANSNEREQRKIAVFFEDGKLKRIEGDVVPIPGADAAAVRAPEVQPAPVVDKAAETKPPAQSAAEPAKPAPAAAAPDKPAEKSWWQRLKDRILP